MLLIDKKVNIKAFLLPGHVSAIIGTKPYRFIAEKYNIVSVISGFEPESILRSILMILEQYISKKADVLIEYNSIVKEDGNPNAIKQIYDVFEITDSIWRGIGIIENSGLELKEEFQQFNAKIFFPVDKIDSEEPKGCECGNVLKGIKKPTDCKKFNKSCTPYNPVGPCMVSSEGTCAAYFKFLSS